MINLSVNKSIKKKYKKHSISIFGYLVKRLPLRLQWILKKCVTQNVVEHISKEDINSTFFKSMLEPQNGVDAISIALLILHKITLTNTIKIKKPRFRGF